MLFVQDLISATIQELNFIIDIEGYTYNRNYQYCIKKGFCSTALVIDTFYFNYCSLLTQY